MGRVLRFTLALAALSVGWALIMTREPTVLPPVYAQTLAAGVITTAGADCSVSTRCLILPERDLRNNVSFALDLDVGTTGIFHFEGKIENTPATTETGWFAVPDDVGGLTSTTADSRLFFSNPGYRHFRIRASAINGTATLSVTRGFTALRTTITTATLTGGTDPCNGAAKTYLPISQITSTQLVTGTAAARTYICHISLVTATAQNIALVSGTGAVCATSTGPMMGGTTAATGWNFAINGGIVAGTGSAAVAKSDTDADNICLLQLGVGQVSGVIAYVVAVN